MMTPKICRPVRLLPEKIIAPALREEFPIDAKTGAPAINPQTGKPEFYWDYERGSNPFPTAPPHFREPVPCENECYVFAGFSRAFCLVGCHR